MLWRFYCNGGPIFKVVKKGVMNPILSISMACNVISCRKVAKTLKF